MTELRELAEVERRSNKRLARLLLAVKIYQRGWRRESQRDEHGRTRKEAEDREERRKDVALLMKAGLGSVVSSIRMHDQ